MAVDIDLEPSDEPSAARPHRTASDYGVRATVTTDRARELTLRTESTGGGDR